MTNPPNSTIFKYVYNKPKKDRLDRPTHNRFKVGLVVAIRRHDNTIGLGYSLCSGNKGDTFDSVRALEIAIGRAESFPNFKDDVPHSVQNDWAEIYGRATRYFKGSEIV